MSSENLREVLTSASVRLRDAAAMERATHSADVQALIDAGGYARGVLDATAAVMADLDAEWEPEQAALDRNARERDPSTGRFMPTANGTPR